MELPLESSEIVGTPFCVKEESYKAIKKKFEKARLGEENSEPGLVGILAFESYLSHSNFFNLLIFFGYILLNYSNLFACLLLSYGKNVCKR